MYKIRKENVEYDYQHQLTVLSVTIDTNLDNYLPCAIDIIRDFFVIVNKHNIIQLITCR